MHHHFEGHRTRRHYGHNGHEGLVTGLFALSAGVVAFVVASRYLRNDRTYGPVDAPASARRRRRARNWREDTLVGRTLTIDRPRQELYSYWRDFSKLPDFMENVRSVEVLTDTRSRWTIAAPGEANVTFETVITDDRPGEMIAWRSVEDAPVRNSGQVVFRDAPRGRGTQVEIRIAYDPPGGLVGRMSAKLFQREPEIQARRELRRFKQLMETGEIATAEAGSAAPRGD